MEGKPLPAPEGYFRATSGRLGSQGAVTGLFKCFAEVGIPCNYRELGEFINDVLWWTEQYSPISLGQHRGVIVGVAGRDDPEVEVVKRLHRLPLRVLLPQVVVLHHAVFINGKLVAEQGGVPKLTHHGCGEFVEGVGEYYHLEPLAQPVEKLPGALQWRHAIDNRLYIR